MKPEPRYGYFPRWPENTDDWIHPDDIELAKRCIHSNRIWRREGEAPPFVVLHHGEIRLRVRPTLWSEIKGEGIEIGDWVEVLSRMQTNEYRIARICEMVWDERQHAICYTVENHAGQSIPTIYYLADLRPVKAISPS